MVLTPPTLHEEVAWPSMYLLGYVWPISIFGRQQRYELLQPFSWPLSVRCWTHGWTQVFISFNIQTGEAISAIRRGQWWSGWVGTWHIRKRKGSAKSWVVIVNVAATQFCLRAKNDFQMWCETRSRQKQLKDVFAEDLDEWNMIEAADDWNMIEAAELVPTKCGQGLVLYLGS